MGENQLVELDKLVYIPLETDTRCGECFLVSRGAGCAAEPPPAIPLELFHSRC